MAKKSNSRLSKKLAALDTSERINKLWQDTTTKSEALQNSAGESRPEYESHVLDLLEHRSSAQAPESRKAQSSAKRSKKEKQ